MLTPKRALRVAPGECLTPPRSSEGDVDGQARRYHTEIETAVASAHTEPESVHTELETDDGALIYMTYRGMRHGPDAVMKRMSAGERVDPADYYFRIQPWFETAAPGYAWLNRMVCVGLGDRLEKGPKYTIHEIL